MTATELTAFVTALGVIVTALSALIIGVATARNSAQRAQVEALTETIKTLQVENERILKRNESLESDYIALVRRNESLEDQLLKAAAALKRCLETTKPQRQSRSRKVAPDEKLS